MGNVLSLLNIISVIAVIAVNALANILPINGRMTGELSDQYPNLFVPAGLTFAIWGVIYLLMLVFAVDQGVRIFRPGAREVTRAIGWWFVISSLANSGWIFAWHYERVFLSLLMMLLLLGSLLVIYWKLGIGLTAVDLRTRFAVHLLFSVYLGWITVATIANVTAWLVSIGWNRIGLSEVFWTVAVLLVATGITLLMIRDRGDLAYALVVIWAFAGILIKRLSPGALPTPVLVWTLIICLGAIATAALLSARRWLGSA